MARKKKSKGKSTIPGQARPVDTATAVLWRDPQNFAEVFNRAAFHENVLSPQNLVDQDTSETALIEIRDGVRIALKRIRDVAKGAVDESSAMLAILGIEDQFLIDYLMPFRTLSMDYLNLARQVSIIQQRHKAELNNQKSIKNISDESRYSTVGKPNRDEYVGGFYKTDRLVPTITLVIYYGEKPWDGPGKLSDLYEDSPLKAFAPDYPMYLLDVRRMSEEEIDSYSQDLRSFLGFLKYEKTDKLVDFIEENRASFSNLPVPTIDALIHITHSPELVQFKRENRTPEGGINVCYGFEVYANRMATAAANEESKKSFVEAAKYFKHSLSETIQGFIVQFNAPQDEAEKEVKKYWN